MDTGAQVSLISEDWLQENLPDIEVQDVKYLLDQPDQLHVRWGNSQEIPFRGWVDLEFQVPDIQETVIRVPFWVTKQKVDYPIIGYNVIKEIIQSCDQTTGNVIMQKMLLPCEKTVTAANVDAVVNLIMGDKGIDATVMFRNRATIIRAGETMKLQCKSDVGLLEKRRPALISADSVELPEGLEVPDSLLTLKAGMNSKVHVQIRNSSDHDILLPKETVVGKLEMVSSVHTSTSPKESQNIYHRSTK